MDQCHRDAWGAHWVSCIKPARVQLNTVCRPPAEKCARSISIEQMQTLRAFFSDPVDIVGEIPAPQVAPATVCTAGFHEIVAMLCRRPCTAEDVAAGLRIHVNEALKKLEQLVAAGMAPTLAENKKIFYAAGKPVEDNDNRL
jgi:wyosine [tRNA(Phe)-imidazoG37] synthetase (radical SAM superfamily)